jgi:hypothetical protein
MFKSCSAMAFIELHNLLEFGVLSSDKVFAVQNKNNLKYGGISWLNAVIYTIGLK